MLNYVKKCISFLNQYSEKIFLGFVVIVVISCMLVSYSYTVRAFVVKKNTESVATKTSPRYMQFVGQEKIYQPIHFAVSKVSTEDALYLLTKITDVPVYISPDIDLTQTVSNISLTAGVDKILQRMFPDYAILPAKDNKGLQVIDRITEMIEVPTLPLSTVYKAKLSSSPGNSNSGSNKLSSAEISLERNSADANSMVSVWKEFNMMIGNVLSKQGSFSISPDIGVITVTDYPRYVDKVKKLIDKSLDNMNRQAVVTVCLAEVILDVQHNRGIDWSKVINIVFHGSATAVTIGSDLASANSGIIPAFVLTAKDNSLDATLKAIDQYGTLHVLQRPVVTATNRVPVLISAGKSQSYISNVRVDVAAGGSGSVVTQTPTIDEVKEGLTLSLVANIKSNNQVLLDLTPVVSRVDSFKTFTFSSESFTAPILNERSLSSRVTLKKGQMLIIGGLFSTTDNKTKSGSDWLGKKKIPIISKLFSRREKESETSELVIFLQVDNIIGTDTLSSEMKTIMPDMNGFRVFK